MHHPQPLGTCKNKTLPMMITRTPIQAVIILLLAGLPGTPAASAGSTTAGNAMEQDLHNRVNHLEQHVSVPVELVDVRQQLDQDVEIHVRSLRGEAIPTRRGKPVNMDDPSSYAIKVYHAEIAMGVQSLSALVTRYVFAGGQALIRNVDIKIIDQQLVQTGTLVKLGLSIPFKVTGRLVARGGFMRMVTTRVQALGWDVTRALSVPGLDAQSFAPALSHDGVWVEGNEFVIDPGRIGPPPRLLGRILDVRLDGNQVVQVFGPSLEGGRL